MRNYQYILFDWDGNLARTLDIWLAALKAPLEKRGHSFTDKQIGANFTVFRERMKTLGVADIDAIITEARKLVEQNESNVELYPDALATLQTLHGSGKKLALVTTSRHSQVDTPLEKYHLRDLFDAVVCGDDVTHHKPHPEPIEQALEHLGGRKDEAVMIGDSGSDLNAAAHAGVDSILFFPPAHATFYNEPELRALHPVHVIESFRDLPRLVSV